MSGPILIQGGRVVDPLQGIDDIRDILIVDGLIADTPPPSPAPETRVIDAHGCIVTPGLVDLHGHWYEGSPYGIDPAFNLRGGVTTAVDQGTVGYANFEYFRRHSIDSSPVRLLVFLHIAAPGLSSTLTPELADIREARPVETAATIREHPDIAVGVKVRIGTEASGDNGTVALRLAVEAASEAGVPVMAHIAAGADLAEVLATLRPGDLVTHCYSGAGVSVLDPDGNVRQQAWAARERGILFDVGHGCGSFSWEVATAALAQGFSPDVISTDLHRFSVEYPVVDLPTTLSKFLHLGMDLTDVIAAATVAPARTTGQRLPSLAPGALAEVAVLGGAGPTTLTDSVGISLPTTDALTCRYTVIGGDIHIAASIRPSLRALVAADLEVDCTTPRGSSGHPRQATA